MFETREDESTYFEQLKNTILLPGNSLSNAKENVHTYTVSAEAFQPIYINHLKEEMQNELHELQIK